MRSCSQLWRRPVALLWSEEGPGAAASPSQPPDPKHMASARLPHGGLRPEIPETRGKRLVSLLLWGGQAKDFHRWLPSIYPSFIIVCPPLHHTSTKTQPGFALCFLGMVGRLWERQPTVMAKLGPEGLHGLCTGSQDQQLPIAYQAQIPDVLLAACSDSRWISISKQEITAVYACWIPPRQEAQGRMYFPLRGKGIGAASLEAQGRKIFKVPFAVFSTQFEILTCHGANQRMARTRLRSPGSS